MKIVALFLLVTLLGTAQTAPSPAEGGVGSVRGRVVDAGGEPIKGALVSSEPTTGVAQGVLATTTTDDHGVFFLDGLPEGENTVLASKEADFYPDARFAFFVTDVTEFPRISISSGKTTKDVVVHLSHKGARLVGEIIDWETREPVITARIQLTRQDDPKLFLSTGPDKQGRFDFVVPSRPFLMEVSAPSYRTWSSAREDGGTATIALKPESVKKELVELHREP